MFFGQGRFGALARLSARAISSRAKMATGFSKRATAEPSFAQSGSIGRRNDAPPERSRRTVQDAVVQSRRRALREQKDPSGRHVAAKRGERHLRILTGGSLRRKLPCAMRKQPVSPLAVSSAGELSAESGEGVAGDGSATPPGSSDVGKCVSVTATAAMVNRGPTVLRNRASVFL